MFTSSFAIEIALTAKERRAQMPSQLNLIGNPLSIGGLDGRRKTNGPLRNVGLRRDSKEGADTTDKNLNHSFKAYLRKAGNPDRVRAVLKREDMDQQGDNSDSKGLGAVDHHIRCSRLACGLGHRDWDQDHCMRGSSMLDDSGHLLFLDNRLFHGDRLCHHRICGVCLDRRQEDRLCERDSRSLRRMGGVDS